MIQPLNELITSKIEMYQYKIVLQPLNFSLKCNIHRDLRKITTFN